MTNYKILGRLRKKYGGTIEEFVLPSELATHIDSRWEFVSELEKHHQFIGNLKDRYTMLYNTLKQI